MENGLVKVSMPLNEIMKMAEIFAQSGMFETSKSMAQAFVKIQAGQELGISAFAAMSGIHIIKGKATIGAGIIASAVKGSGKYDYKVKELSEKKCSLDFYQGATFIGNSTFTIEDAKKAGTQNLEKFPKNMLFARAISNGVKWYSPDVFSGPVYVPEEMQTTEDVSHEVIQQVEEKPKSKLLSDSNFAKGLKLLESNFSKAVETFKQYDLIEIQKTILDQKIFEICKDLKDPVKQYELLQLYSLPQNLIDLLIDNSITNPEITTDAEKLEMGNHVN